MLDALLFVAAVCVLLLFNAVHFGIEFFMEDF